ncbi:MAG TPA: ATP-binding cassette domain-containing protein [Gaiellaceae bacterium]|nr:ATP-binding cassette domain-containing protein [Gaiellaceae bacterium]
MAAAPAIAVAGLGRDYGRVRAVDAIDLEVQPGEFFGFLGPNGAGKTTTIRMLTTLLSPSRGEARVAGSDVVDDALAVRRQIGVVFQETTLDLDLTAEENLRFCTRLYGLSRRESKARIDEALRLFGLSERRHARVRSFSGGMRRALDLARGILHRPSIVFLDEPTLGLDPGQRRRIWAFLQKLVAEHGTTLFLTTHYLEEADPCDRVAIVDHGQIVALGQPDELKRNLGRDRIDVRTERPDVFLASVRELTGLEPQRAQHGLSVFVDDAATVLPKLLPLTAQGAEVGVTRPTLEDVFVDLTGRSREAA